MVGTKVMDNCPKTYVVCFWSVTFLIGQFDQTFGAPVPNAARLRAQATVNDILKYCSLSAALSDRKKDVRSGV